MISRHSFPAASLAAALAELPSLSREQLVELWAEHMGKPPPKAASTPLLVRAIAYTIQERQLGGLKRPELRILRKVARSVGEPVKPRETAKTGKGGARSQGVDRCVSPHAGNNLRDPLQGTEPLTKSRPAIPIVLKPGARLVREWQGKSHTVDVRGDGFGWNGNVYRSLSAVARAITGTHLSGNRFFRL